MAERVLPLPSSAIDCDDSLALDQGWQLAATAPGVCADPYALPADLIWRGAIVPGTVAMNTDEPPGGFDADDWWYRCSFAAPEPARKLRLRFDGLATLADVWLNGQPLLTTDNMFLPRTVDIDTPLRAENELVIRFRSLHHALAAKRPRPRWKTALVNHQQLRWLRTTLLGRMPGWAPSNAPVGPWRGIYLERAPLCDIVDLDLQCRAGSAGGVLEFAATVQHAAAHAVADAQLRVGAQHYPVVCTAAADGTRLRASLNIPDAPLWWPHTHGEPRQLACGLELRLNDTTIAVDCGRVGFKRIELDRSGGQVRFAVNGEPVFCRGACWTIDDLKAPADSPQQLRRTLELARAAGVNLLRVGGTMAYEGEAFYALCDELGILVWQDFMFANMDYPFADETFRRSVDAEIDAQLRRLQRHACIAVYCGGSETQQQAAMLGLPREQWSNEFFDSELPRRCVELHAGIPYFPATPCEGALPFHTAHGIAHYYGVGAYRRPLSDVRLANVKFAAECLAFANVPEPQTMELIADGATPVPHHPAWKAGVPRDNGSGWDFEDIRDHYVQQLFGLDPVALRSRDLERYYALSRVAPGELMQRVYADWRRPHSGCGGALVWFYKDLRPGAGWGIVDSENRPKAVYYYLKRAWATRALLITDEGLDGLQLHAINETREPVHAIVELEALQTGTTTTARATQAVAIPARAGTTLSAETLLGYFFDTAYAYRFGPPKHDVLAARLRCAHTGAVLGEDFYFPQGLNLPYQHSAQVEAQAQFETDGAVTVRVAAPCFLQSVCIEARGYEADDNYFHLAPHQIRVVRLTPRGAAADKFRGSLGALNLRDSITLKAERRVPA